MLKINKIKKIIIDDYVYIGLNKRQKYKLSLIRVKSFLMLFIIIIFKYLYRKYSVKFYDNYLDLIESLKIKYDVKKKIRIALYTKSLVNGGRARITSILYNYLYQINFFTVYLFTENIFKTEYKLENNSNRIIIKNNLFQKLNENNIDILIYQLNNVTEINQLNKLKKLKVIFYQHGSVFGWIYLSLNYFKLIYKAFKNSKYIVTILPYENDYLFEKWGIKSILMNNFISFEYNSIIPSNLSSKTILMIGRGEDKIKRFNLGIMAMKYIIKEVPNSELKIISSLKKKSKLKDLVNQLNLNNNIKFMGFTTKPEIYFKNASLHLFPSLFESFGLVLSETKIYGIPNILLGLDYISTAQGGTIIIYDDKPESISKEAIKILKNDNYRKKLGKEARKSMKKFNNNKLVIKWVKLILSVNKGEYFYNILRKQDKQMSQKDAIKIIRNQIKLLKMRKIKLKNLTEKQFENFTFMMN